MTKTRNARPSSAYRPSWDRLLFLDANILIYGLSGQSAECRHLLQRCSREEVTGISMYEVINNATHRFMLMEAHSKGLIAKATPSNLKGNCAVIRQITDYWQKTSRLLNLNLLLIGLDDGMIRNAETERQSACLLTNDSMIVACMRSWQINVLATNDADFLNVTGITVYKPGDVP